MGAFSYHRFILACIDRWEAYNRLVSVCTVKTAIEVQRLCVSTSKKRYIFGLLRFSPSFLFACAAIIRVNLAFRTTIIEDTHPTLASIPFKVEGNNSLIFFYHYKHTRKICQVSVPFHSIIP